MAVITGSSTHNERIERLWRDVYRCVSVLFADTFRKLEDERKLDSLNEIDLYCLHFVFKPRINFTLASFIECWNNHSISTEKNCTPNQLFIQGIIEANNFPELQHTAQLPSGTARPSPRDHVQIPHFTFLCHSLFRCQELILLNLVMTLALILILLKSN